MTLSAFINKYINTKVDYDGAFGAQCVDLFRQYLKDVWELPHTGAVEGAKDLWYKYAELPLEQKYLCKTKVSRPGDVVIFKQTKTNKYGHVAILIAKLTETEILVFEQDGFKQDGAKMTIRGTDNVAGYFFKRGTGRKEDKTL